MRLVYIHQHFCTNEGTSGTRSYDVSRYLIEAGHQITMICGLSDQSGLKPMPWYRLFRRDNIDGIELIVCNVPYSNRLGVLARYWAFCWFAVLGTIAAVSVRRPDVVFATSTPLSVGVPGYLAATVKRVPFVFEVRDLWPESFIRSGWVKGTELSIRIMSWLETFIYDRAAKILLVSPGFEKRLIERGFPPGKLKTILLGADDSLFETVTPDPEFLAQYQLEGKALAIYTGAHGKANGLDYILAAAEHSRGRPDIAYVLLGEGSEKPRLNAIAREKRLTNVVFADAVPKKRLPGILALCHIGLMILKDVDEPRPVTPNKIFDYMFTKLPALVNFEGPTIEMVEREGCGLFVDPKRPAELAEKVAKLAGDPDVRRELGARGRKAAVEKYGRRNIAGQLAETFGEVLAASSGKKAS